jgi:hypothetical protein
MKKKLNHDTTAKVPLVKEPDDYSKMNQKLDKIIDIMSSMLSELKKLNNYNSDRANSQSLFNPFSTSR